MHISDLTTRAAALISQGNKVVETQYNDTPYNLVWVDAAAMSGFRAASLSFIERVYGRTHPHYQEFARVAAHERLSNALGGVAILEAVLDEIGGGWLFSMRGLITSEVFADFLEMADYLLGNHFKDAAAVMIGGVLEEHLRQLCKVNDIEIYLVKEEKQIAKTADRMNNDLYAKSVYSPLDHKAVTSWLALRNKAAHAHYDEYTKEQVSIFYDGVLNFLSRVPL